MIEPIRLPDTELCDGGDPDQIKLLAAVVEEMNDPADDVHLKDYLPAEWCAIFAEKVGEAVKELNELHFRPDDAVKIKAMRELVQTAAVALTIARAIKQSLGEKL